MPTALPLALTRQTLRTQVDRTSVCLSPVVNAVNSSGAGRVAVEKHPPFAHAKTTQSFPVCQLFHVTFAGLTVPRKRNEDSHRCVAVETPQIGTRRWLPDELQSPNSLRTSSCAIPADGWARASSMRANISESTEAS